MRRVVSLLGILLACGACAADATVQREGDRIVLANALVQRTLALDAGVWRTLSFSRADGSDQVAVGSDEFLIRLMDGSELTASDYVAADEPVLNEGINEASVRVTYLPRGADSVGAPRAVEVQYWLGNGPYLRKRLVLTMGPGSAVDRLEVERFRTLVPCDRGGRGEPVFIGGDWFAGLEYPGSQTTAAQGVVSLAHFPGLAKQTGGNGSWAITSKTAVIGTGSPGDPLELAFSDYVDTIRRPARNFLQYNSWYDWRGDELNLDNLLATFDAFKRKLLDPYGLHMDAFVPDDGWQDYNSIWLPRANLYPEGFGPLREALEARGTRLGIWMPLNGTNLNTDWGVAQGYERSNHGGFYCLVGPRYNQAIRHATRRIIEQANLAYYKHDFNTLACSADGHGHLPTERHGHEANLDAELELLAYERELQPDIFLNVTSNVWLSPWWLAHADSVWMCAGDFGYDKTWPQLSAREWDMSYRDAHFYQVYHQWRSLVPVSAMMTHGIIHGRYCKLGGDEETRREWSDMVVLYYGRGVQLKELYITPEMVPENWWPVLGEATRWAVENAKVLEKVVMVGGDPRKGEVYGYAHWLEDRGILCLRNPDVQERTAEVAFDKSVLYRGAPGRPFRGRVIYPFVEDIYQQFMSGEPVRISVPGCTVMVVELKPGQAPAGTPALPPPLQGFMGEAAVDDQGRPHIRARLPVPNEQMDRCDLYLIVRSAGAGLEPVELRLNGELARPRRASGPGWALQSLDLRSLRGSVAELSAFLPGGGDQPFSSPEAKVSVWLIADRPVAAAPAPAEHLPLAISQHFRRQTTCIVPETSLSRQRRQRTITEEDLRTIRAAKLRIRVFDVNPEPQYQGKFITLNGQPLAPVPPNQGELSAWQESVIDLQPEQLSLVRLENVVVLGNAGGDCYKFSGLCLAVQLADGTWVESNSDETVRSTPGAWAYAEGEIFEGTTGEIRLQF